MFQQRSKAIGFEFVKDLSIVWRMDWRETRGESGRPICCCRHPVERRWWLERGGGSRSVEKWTEDESDQVSAVHHLKQRISLRMTGWTSGGQRGPCNCIKNFMSMCLRGVDLPLGSRGKEVTLNKVTGILHSQDSVSKARVWNSPPSEPPLKDTWSYNNNNNKEEENGKCWQGCGETGRLIHY